MKKILALLLIALLLNMAWIAVELTALKAAEDVTEEWLTGPHINVRWLR